MNIKRMRAAFFTAALLFICTAGVEADFSTNALLGYLTGIPALSDSAGINFAGINHPADLVLDNRPYVEAAGSLQEVVRSLNEDKKDIAHGVMSFGVKYPLIHKRAGVYLSITDNSTVASWPFSDDRVVVNNSYDASKVCLSAYASGDKYWRTGITLGKQVRGVGDGFLNMAEFTGVIPFGLSGSVRYYSIPCEWGIGVKYENVEKMIPSQFRDSGFEGEMNGLIDDRTSIGFTVKMRGIDTSQNFRGVPDRHAQVWDIEGDGWLARIQHATLRGITASMDFGVDTISGDVGLWYNGSQYLRGMLDGETSRFGVGAVFNRVSRFVPEVNYNRISTDIALTHGIADSWPFTPQDIEIIGDKTWTFSGKGSIVSNAVTCMWKAPTGLGISLTYARAYIDYRMRIVTRDHLSADPMDIIFGRSRTETDRTRYYDFALASYGKSFKFWMCDFDLCVRQFIPLFHSEKKIPGKAPVLPSFPKLKVAKPKRIGGLSFEVMARWML